MISTIGRSPFTAEPKAAPASASSEMGVSNTRRWAVLLVEAGRRRENAAGCGDVLAEEDHALIEGELLVERVVDRGAEGDRRHQRASTSGRSSSSQRRDRKRAPSAP